MSGERNYLFALTGLILFVPAFFAIKPEGIRSATDTVALYLGLICCFVQIVIWIATIARRRR